MPKKRIAEILDSTYTIKQRMTQPDVPSDIIPLVDDLIKDSLDEVCGLQLRRAFVRAIDTLFAEGGTVHGRRNRFSEPVRP